MAFARSPQQAAYQALPRLYALTRLEDFPQHVSEVVLGAIGGDKCDYTAVDRDTGDFRVFVWPEPVQLGELDEARRAVMGQHPALGHFLGASSRGTRAISDFLTTRQYHRLGLYGEFFRPLGVEDQLTIAVTEPGARYAAAISVDRAARSFSDADRTVLTLLEPHLVRAQLNSSAYSAALKDDTPPQLNPRLARLSNRQHEILCRLASGLSNSEIAHDLGISSGTVRKHVENLLRALQVPNRTAAAVLLARSGRTDARWTAELSAFIQPGLAPT